MLRRFLPPALIIILIGVAAAFGGYYAALRAPVPPQLAILDLDALIQDANARHPGDPRSASKAVEERVGALTGSLTARGIVVIDAKAVVAAPEGAHVPLD